MLKKMTETDHFQSFFLIFRLFKLVLETRKNFQILGNVLLHVYFLERKIWPSNISSSVPKTYYRMQKMSKMTIFILFVVAVFRVLNIDYGKYWKIIKFLEDALSYFAQRNTLLSNITSLVLKILKKMQKMT